MIEENGQEMLKVEHAPDAFVDNMDRMWKRFLELAIETCPIEKDQIEQVFKGSGVDDYVGEFEACDRQFE